MKLLARTFTLTQEGIAWEGDEKHVEAFQKKMERHETVGTSPSGSGGSRKMKNGVATPGVKREVEKYDVRKPLDGDGV